MTFTTSDGLLYAESHEWVDDRADVVRIGITDFAQDELGDIVFVELPAEGVALERGEPFAVVESIKAVSDIYAPVSGTVTAVNETVSDRPELVNEHPFERGWLIELETTDELGHLLEPDEYREQI
ncbi:glycine cleavage system protein GcvH [Natronorubrum halophilum]|uniref:glycine cleavage system protein GcvH n=1 Tax=Natronorubrum halophilum TaxID=1702106 RepID=UPI000EF6D933|nr:glycine cleavage system protein GcvH [Natronorubrum halophilum]